MHINLLPIVREMKKVGIPPADRKRILEQPEMIANLIGNILSFPEPAKDICMSALGLGNEAIESFRKQIGEKNFHQAYELFKALESFYYHFYDLDLGVYIMDITGNGELLIGNQNTHKRDMHLQSQDSLGIDYKNEVRSMYTGRFESSNPIEGDGAKGAIRIDIPGGKIAILSFGDMGSDYSSIQKVAQGFEKGGFDQIILAKLQHIHKVYKDSLTGLYNREYFDQIAEKHAYSIINIDVNNFKTVNDTFGHAMGDQVLQELAIILQKSIRKNDKACRFGGDEFLLLIDIRDEVVLENIVSAIRSRLQQNQLIQSLNSQMPKNLDLAVGWCVFQRNIPLIERLKIADQRMYANKVVMGGCARCEE